MTDANTGRDEDAQAQIVDALDELFEHDDQWSVVPSPGCLTASRGWPDGSVDTLIILSVNIAYGRREDARQRQVWAVRGTVDQVAALLIDLPAPFEPNAPTTPDSSERTGYWT